MKPNEITMEKALELLSGPKVTQIGRRKGKRKVEDVEAIEAF
jgi:topoisomerase IA-like protein